MSKKISKLKESKDFHKQAQAIVKTLGVGVSHIFDALPFYIMLVDSDHHILLANKAVKPGLGKDPSQIIGKYCPKVVHGLDEPFPGCPLEEAVKKGIAVERELFDANYGRWMNSAIYPIERLTKEGRQIFLHIVLDITERKQAEDQIKASLKEKDLLLQEIHHRVKNNMQVISSLISLQASKIKNKHSLEMFKETRDRVKSMAIIHDYFYRSKDFTKIDFCHSIRSIISHLFLSYGVDQNSIKMRINGGRFYLDIDRAIPCGLIINELVSNSLKHAFPESKGEIRISLRSKANKKLTMVVSDNGVGLPEDLDVRNTNSLGFSLINILADQLNGNIKLQRKRGTTFEITFNAPKKYSLISCKTK